MPAPSLVGTPLRETLAAGVSSGTLSGTVTPSGSNRRGWVAFSGDTGGSNYINGATWNGVPMTQVDGIFGTGGSVEIVVFVTSTAPAASAGTVAWTMDGGSILGGQAIVWATQDTDQSATPYNTPVKTAGAAAVTVAVASGELGIGCCESNVAGSMTLQAPATVIAEGESGSSSNYRSSAGYQAGVGGNITFTFNNVNTSLSAVIGFSVLGTGAGGPTLPFITRLDARRI